MSFPSSWLSSAQRQSNKLGRGNSQQTVKTTDTWTYLELIDVWSSDVVIHSATKHVHSIFDYSSCMKQATWRHLDVNPPDNCLIQVNYLIQANYMKQATWRHLDMNPPDNCLIQVNYMKQATWRHLDTNTWQLSNTGKLHETGDLRALGHEHLTV